MQASDGRAGAHSLCAAPLLVLAWVGAFEWPVANEPGPPLIVLLARQDEAADCLLATLVVPVEQIDGQRLTCEERLAQTLTKRVVGLAYRPLPKTDIARGHVQ